MDFSWIFADFWMQVGTKLASKIAKKTIEKSIKKMMANKRHLEASWKRLGTVLEDFSSFGGRPCTGYGRGWFARPPKSRFFKTDQTPLELGIAKGKGTGKHKGKYRGLGKGKWAG